MISTLVFSLYVLTSLVPEDLFWMAEAFAADTPKLRFVRKADGGEFYGEIDRSEDKRVIQEIVNQAEGKIRDQTKFSAAVLRDFHSQLQAHTKVPIFISNGNLEVKSNLNQAELQKLRSIFPWIKVHHQRTSPRSSNEAIFIELAFVEIKKQALEKLGLSFGSPIEFGTSLFLKRIKTPADVIKLEGFNPVGSYLDFAIREGSAKVHFKQSVLGENEKSSVFEVGGEYSVRLQSRESSQIGHIHYGVRLEFYPQLLGGKKVQLKIDAQIREPDLTAGIDGLPLIQTKNLKTELAAPLGESFAIGGFVRSQEMRSRQGVPLLSEIPFFGSLLSSREFLEHKSEAYLFITARTIEKLWRPRPEGVLNVD